MPLWEANAHFLSWKELENIWLGDWKIYWTQISSWIVLSTCFCVNVLDLLEGFQSYSGHPRISLFLLFSSSSHLMRGWKYCMSGWALILVSPVIMAMASGQGLLKPSFIMSLWTTPQVREEVRGDEDQWQECHVEIITHMPWSMFSPVPCTYRHYNLKAVTVTAMSVFYWAKKKKTPKFIVSCSVPICAAPLILNTVWLL